MAKKILIKDAPDYFAPKTGPLAKEIHSAGLAGLLKAAERVTENIVTRAIPSATPKPIDKGTYRSGWKLKKTKDGVVIVNTAPHAGAVEKGVPGARVAVGGKAQKAVAEWIVRKLGGPRESGSNKGASKIASQGTQAAKKRFEAAKTSYSDRRKKASAQGRPAPNPPKPPAALSARRRVQKDLGAAWQAAAAILRAAKKRGGLFMRGKGFRIGEKEFSKAGIAGILKAEIGKQLKKVGKA